MHRLLLRARAMHSAAAAAAIVGVASAGVLFLRLRSPDRCTCERFYCLLRAKNEILSFIRVYEYNSTACSKQHAAERKKTTHNKIKGHLYVEPMLSFEQIIYQNSEEMHICFTSIPFATLGCVVLAKYSYNHTAIAIRARMVVARSERRAYVGVGMLVLVS